MKPNLKKLLPFVGLAALTALGTVGILKKDEIAYKIYQKSYKHQIKKENITTYD
jgi:branched-subunit amino acid transport protein|tara:strand:+ start:142 stop:303 length:162 start_codon:yes stop_codon:yes gene_type:complete